MESMPRINWYRVGISAGLAVGGAMIIGAFAIGKTGGDAQNLPLALEAISPGPGAQVERQTEIVADLAPGFDGLLVINGIEIPADQYTFDSGLNQVIFPCRPSDIPAAALGAEANNASEARPACSRGLEGAEEFEVPTGNVSVAVEYWPITRGRGEASKVYFWTFRTY